MLNGSVDETDHRQIVGWARDDGRPDAPVSLLITDNGTPVARVLANRYRRDLQDAGIGSGRHAFSALFDRPLSLFEPHILRVIQEGDGAEVPGSPVRLDPPRELDAEVKAALPALLAQIGTAEQFGEAIDFLVDQVDSLLQRLADLEGERGLRRHYREYLQRWRRRETPEIEPLAPPSRRALVLDDRVPVPTRDAGSNAILGHVDSLTRLGYQITFIAVDEFMRAGIDLSALQSRGVLFPQARYYGSVEEVMMRQAGTFDLVYLHRVSNASKYNQLARHYFPLARQIYSVADLHHLRVARQSVVEDRPELVSLSRRLQRAELSAAAAADIVITHSSYEAALLGKSIIPASKTQIVRWPVEPAPTAMPFAARRGVALIGGYAHRPNIDAARWMITEIMPLVRARAPDIDLLIVGAEMPANLAALCGDGCMPIGQVEDLSTIFDRVRLTVAPLTFGAGIKGKVLLSLAAGVPCVGTPIAMEGLDLPSGLSACCADKPQSIADAIIRLHGDEALNGACAQLGLNYVTAKLARETIDAMMSQIVLA